MSVNVARIADGWWVDTTHSPVRLGVPGGTTAQLPAHREVLNAAVNDARSRADERPGQAMAALAVTDDLSRRGLRHSDLVTASISSADGSIDLGPQRNIVVEKTP